MIPAQITDTLNFWERACRASEFKEFRCFYDYIYTKNILLTNPTLLMSDSQIFSHHHLYFLHKR